VCQPVVFTTSCSDLHAAMTDNTITSSRVDEVPASSTVNHGHDHCQSHPGSHHWPTSSSDSTVEQLNSGDKHVVIQSVRLKWPLWPWNTASNYACIIRPHRILLQSMIPASVSVSHAGRMHVQKRLNGSTSCWAADSWRTPNIVSLLIRVGSLIHIPYFEGMAFDAAFAELLWPFVIVVMFVYEYSCETSSSTCDAWTKWWNKPAYDHPHCNSDLHTPREANKRQIRHLRTPNGLMTTIDDDDDNYDTEMTFTASSRVTHVLLAKLVCKIHSQFAAKTTSSRSIGLYLMTDLYQSYSSTNCIEDISYHTAHRMRRALLDRQNSPELSGSSASFSRSLLSQHSVDDYTDRLIVVLVQWWLSDRLCPAINVYNKLVVETVKSFFVRSRL